MPLIYQTQIMRQDLRRNPDVLYVFGDNVQRRGLKGQAFSMRGEPNAVGVATKWAPTMAPDSFFRDNRFDEIINIVAADLVHIAARLKSHRSAVVVWPADGIGTGLSQLPQLAPKVWKKLELMREHLESL